MKSARRVASRRAILHKISEPEEQLLLIDLFAWFSIIEPCNGINKGSTIRPSVRPRERREQEEARVSSWHTRSSKINDTRELGPLIISVIN